MPDYVLRIGVGKQPEVYPGATRLINPEQEIPRITGFRPMTTFEWEKTGQVFWGKNTESFYVIRTGDKELSRGQIRRLNDEDYLVMQVL